MPDRTGKAQQGPVLALLMRKLSMVTRFVCRVTAEIATSWVKFDSPEVMPEVEWVALDVSSHWR